MITGMGFIGTKTGGLYRMNGRRTVEKTASGNPITLTDSAENKPLGMTLYGWSKQDGEPSPENPVEIESAGMRWSMGKNLVNADDYYESVINASMILQAAQGKTDILLCRGLYPVADRER